MPIFIDGSDMPSLPHAVPVSRYRVPLRTISRSESFTPTSPSGTQMLAAVEMLAAWVSTNAAGPWSGVALFSERDR